MMNAMKPGEQPPPPAGGPTPSAGPVAPAAPAAPATDTKFCTNCGKQDPACFEVLSGVRHGPISKPMSGLEWIVEAHGCDVGGADRPRRLEELFRLIVAAMDLHPLGKTNWHQFPDTGGITGVSLLTESHLACHTFPEYCSLCLNVFCCRPRPGRRF